MSMYAFCHLWCVQMTVVLRLFALELPCWICVNTPLIYNELLIASIYIT